VHVKIKRLTESDLSALAELFQQFWNENSSPGKMQSTFSRISANPAYILLAARQDGCLVGFAMGIVCEELYGECKPFMVIEDLIVDRSHRRTAVASELMRRLERYAVAHECCQIIFVTEAHRTEALKFYQSMGYEFEPYKGFKKPLGGSVKPFSRELSNG